LNWRKGLAYPSPFPNGRAFFNRQFTAAHKRKRKRMSAKRRMPNMPTDAVLNVHGWMLPVTKFTIEEAKKALQLDNTLKTEVLAHGDVLTGCRKGCSEVLDLIYASVHRADPTLSRAAVSTLIYDFENLVTVYHRIATLTAPLPPRA
jgi:hypothetical protein